EPGTAWTLMQRIDHPDPAAANAQALHDLENGASGLSLIFAGAPVARGYGVCADDAASIGRGLAGVMLELIPLRIETSPFAGRPIANLLMGLIETKRLDPAKLSIDFGLDPIGDMARTGSALLPWPELSARAGGTAKDISENGFD